MGHITGVHLCWRAALTATTEGNEGLLIPAQYITVQYSIVLSAIKAYNGYHPCHRVLWINPAANITFSVITLETAVFKPSTPMFGGEGSNHSAVKLGKSSVR